MRIVSFAIAMTITACSSSSGSGKDHPASCDPTKRAGTYRVTFTKQNGDCGDVPSGLVVIDRSKAAQPGCTVRSESYSEGQCRYDAEIECIQSGVKTTTTGYTIQRDVDGAHLSGELTFNISGPSGCLGTYTVDWVRQ